MIKLFDQISFSGETFLKYFKFIQILHNYSLEKQKNKTVINSIFEILIIKI